MFVPAPRLLYVALAGAVPIALTRSHDAALVVAATWVAIVVALAVIDGRRMDSPVVWSRVHDPKLSLGAWNAIELRAENRSARSVQVQVRDTLSPLLQPIGNAGHGLCPGWGSWSLRYRVFPVQRGDYSLGPVTARYLGPLGLVWHQRTHRFPDDARVYPNLLALARYDAFVRRGQLQELGLRNSRRWGAGTEFERLREYLPDDEYRRISWKATARRRVPVVVEYETESSQNVLLAIDCGRLMSTKLPLVADPSAHRVEARPLTRLDHAVNASLMLGYVSEHVGDRVGLLGFDDHVRRFVSPRAGRGHFLAIADALYNLQSQPTEPDFLEAFAYMASRITRRSLVVVFTDLGSSETAAALSRSLSVIGKRHLCVVVTLRDPAVDALADAPIETVANVYERAVARISLDERTVALRSLRQRGVLTVDTSADDISVDVINRYLAVKARGSL